MLLNCMPMAILDSAKSMKQYRTNQLMRNMRRSIHSIPIISKRIDIWILSHVSINHCAHTFVAFKKPFASSIEDLIEISIQSAQMIIHEFICGRSVDRRNPLTTSMRISSMVISRHEHSLVHKDRYRAHSIAFGAWFGSNALPLLLWSRIWWNEADENAICIGPKMVSKHMASFKWNSSRKMWWPHTQYEHL